MYRQLCSMRSIIGAARIAGLCAIMSLAAAGTARAGGPAPVAGDSAAGFSERLSPGELRRQRASGGAFQQPNSPDGPSKTAVILWDELQRRGVARLNPGASADGGNVRISVSP